MGRQQEQEEGDSLLGPLMVGLDKMGQQTQWKGLCEGTHTNRHLLCLGNCARTYFILS